ncbi:MAG: response regulator [Candidatus Cloacimonetes bacterium]|nr:response regulator [Candidatus Cloacimonadota bacterium]
MSRILLVDDDHSFVETMGGLFAQHGVRIEVAFSCDEALALLSKEAIDIMITDIVLPGKDGLVLISTVRKLYPAIRIIAISGGGRIDKTTYLRLAKDLRADAVLEKPFGWDDLKHLLDSFS